MIVKKKTQKITLLLLSLISSLIVLSGCSMNVSDENGNIEPSPASAGDTGMVRIYMSSPGEKASSKSSVSRNSVPQKNSIENAKKVVLSFVDSSGTIIHDEKEISLVKMSGSHSFQPISLALTTGSYRLTEFMVLDQSNDVIFATPKENAHLAYLVSDPLPSNTIEITKDAVKNVTPEIIDTSGSNFSDFGYAHFTFNVVETFAFALSAFIKNDSTGQYELTGADITVSHQEQILYNNSFAAETSRITLNDGFDSYKVTVKKTGYRDFTSDFSNSQIKAFLDTPLMVNLEKEITEPQWIIKKMTKKGNSMYSGSQEVEYDEKGNMLTRIEDKGNGMGPRKTIFSYDENELLVREDIYKGEISNASNFTVLVQYEVYTYTNRLLSEKKTYECSTAVPGNGEGVLKATIKFEYNAEDLLVKRTESSSSGTASDITYEYNQTGKLVKETQVMSGMTTVFTYEYNAQGLLYKKDIGEGGYITPAYYIYTYNGSGKIISETKYNTDGSVIYESEYIYNGQNQLIKITNAFNPDSQMNYDAEYAYNADGLLEKETRYASGSSSVQVEYTYTYELF